MPTPPPAECSREVIDRYGRGFQRGHARRAREDLFGRNANGIRIAAETGHRHDIAADPISVQPGGGRVDATRDLVAGHDRNGWQVRIKTHAADDVGKIDPARFDANPHFASPRLGIGGFLDL
jgi:hypothetical protein